ncbi:MAG: DNA polymerase III subunit delta' [Bacteroidetes bacterium]|nr:DNA polymerase III subunit delta' [Bacteroidota bacterium]MBL6943559.1 DNA polymerase III subunit delta' [Bacteroidales bacterium]
MQFKSIIGQQTLIDKLVTGYNENRVAHTLLLLGNEGSGALAVGIAFAQFLNCAHKINNDSCGECPSCIKYEKFAHPDLHFYFPTATNQSIKKDPKSSLFLNEWREYLSDNNAYISQNGWYEHLGIGNKQGYIRKDDANELIGRISLKAYESKFKTVIFWMVDRMNESASNKLLKTLEEPPDNTVIILIGEKYEQLLPTVRSRAQLFKVAKLTDNDIASQLIKEGTEALVARDIALLSNGNWNLAKEILNNAEETQSNFINFRKWLRLCFQPKDYSELIKFNQEISKIGREKQKSFLNYGLEVIHNSILHNHNNGSKVKKAGEELDFSKKLSQFINEANQTDMYSALNQANYHVERNAHAGILFSDLSFTMVDLIAKGSKFAK